MTAPSPESTQAELSVSTPDGKVQTILLNQPQYSVGRLGSNDLTFQMVEGLSREHLVLERQSGQWLVRDVGSTNGTFVNGTRISGPTVLKSKDQITAGQLILVFTNAVRRKQDVTFVEGSPDPAAFTTTATLATVLVGKEAAGGEKHMRALIRAGRELVGHMPLQNLFDLILKLSVETVGASRGALMILEDGELRVRATMGVGFRISTGVRDLVLKEKRSLLVHDALMDRAFSGRESIVQQQIRSILAVPLQTEERVIGLVYLDSPFFVHEFQHEDLNMLTVMANIAAIRIEHARLAHIEEAEKIRAKELEHGALIQRSILPSRFPPFPERTDFELHAAMVPAKEVAGDLFDFFLLDQDRLGFVIGDVSGKGVPAALFMAVSRTLLRASAQHQQSPGDCFTYVNETLVEQNVASMFVTLFYGVLNLRTGELQYANGGHNPAYIFAPGKPPRELAGKSGPVLGIFDGPQYPTLTDRLEPGESILLYTDGVPEARSHTGEFFGEARLESFLAAHASEPAVPLTAKLLKTVEDFASGAPQFDDITVLALRYLGSG